MSPAGFEPAIPASERPQTHSLDRAASGILFLFDWMSFLFIGFVYIIPSLDILYSDDHIFLSLLCWYYCCLAECRRKDYVNENFQLHKRGSNPRPFGLYRSAWTNCATACPPSQFLYLAVHVQSTKENYGLSTGFFCVPFTVFCDVCCVQFVPTMLLHLYACRLKALAPVRVSLVKSCLCFFVVPPCISIISKFFWPTNALFINHIKC
jgi:hypothetical protein